MALLKDTGIVLRRLDYSETSQVLVVFTREHGQQRLIAKGVKRATKKKASIGIDLLEEGRVVFSQRPGKEDALATLTEWRQEESFPHLQRDLKRLYAAQYAAELTAQLTEVNDPHPGLFDAMLALMRELEAADPIAPLVRFLWILHREIGLRPELSRCMSCSRPVAGDRVVYFSSRAGGAVCRDCEPHVVEKRRVDGAVLAWLNEVDKGMDSESSANHSHRAAFEFLDYNLTETMGKQARLRGPLLELL